MKAGGLDVLNRRCLRHGAKVGVKRRHAHARFLGKTRDVERRCIFGVNALECPRHASEAAVMRQCGAHRRALLACEHAIADLAHDRRTQYLRIERHRQCFQQPYRRAR